MHQEKGDFALSFLSTPNNGTSCNGCNFSAFQGHCGREGNSEIHLGFEIARGDTRMWQTAIWGCRRYDRGQTLVGNMQSLRISEEDSFESGGGGKRSSFGPNPPSSISLALLQTALRDFGALCDSISSLDSAESDLIWSARGNSAKFGT